MYSIRNKVSIVLVLTVTLMFSCKDLVELNENPNGVDPASAHPNLLLSTVTSSAGDAVVDLGYGNLAGVMQHTLKDGWAGGHNGYEWANQGWSGYYGILRNNDAMYQKAVEMELEFHQGVGLVIKSFVFGMIADLWGDAPYSAALKGELGGAENIQPAFDSQQAIYAGIFADLEEANALLSKSAGEYSDINPTQDLIYGGDPAKWRKFANSLALRYYMRISMKDPGTAKAGIEKIAGNPSQYPIIASAADDANLQYLGNNSTDSWPANTVFDATQESNFRRIKMCATLVDTMRSLNDPRLALWAAPVEIPLVIDPDAPDGTDEIRADGKRYVSQDIADDYQATYGVPLDTNQDFVGLHPLFESFPAAFNLSPDLQQASFNPHVSWLNDRYREPGGSMLKGRMISAAEVHFILAEAALKGWAVGNAQDHYEMGVRNSFVAWEIGGMYDDYIAGGAAYEGSLEQIITQKWIASWTAAAESWFDYRRTGYPELQAPYAAKRTVPPVRFYYSLDELDLNPNGADALENLETTQYTLTDGANSAWSKPWLLQGTGVPW